MLEIRFHGRGGQGNVAAAELLAQAAFACGWEVQAFPAFGAERTGAPVQAFVRLSNGPIRLRSQVYEPDIVVVQDQTLLANGGAAAVCAGLVTDGLVLLNGAGVPDALLRAAPAGAHLIAVPATAIALEVLGRPVPNTTLLGGLAALIRGGLSLEVLQATVRERFPGEVGERNAEAAARGFAAVRVAALVPAVGSRQEGNGRPLGTVVAGDRPVRLPLGLVGSAGSSAAYHTGSWRTFRPVFQQAKCTGCALCAVYCPDACVLQLGPKRFDVDLAYCKGCGLCAEECPVGDIAMVPEPAPAVHVGSPG